MTPTDADASASRPLRIVGLGGSTARISTSLAAARVVLDHAQRAGAQTRLFDVRLLDLPPYDPDVRGSPSASVALADAVHEADALVWSSPMYHGTVSGSFKNALDWLQLLADAEPAFLTSKPVGLVATSAGVQGLQAINTMEFVVRALRGWTIPLTVPVSHAFEAFDEEGRPRDAAVARQLEMLANETVAAARRFSAPVAPARPERGLSA